MNKSLQVILFQLIALSFCQGQQKSWSSIQDLCVNCGEGGLSNSSFLFVVKVKGKQITFEEKSDDSIAQKLSEPEWIRLISSVERKANTAPLTYGASGYSIIIVLQNEAWKKMPRKLKRQFNRSTPTSN